MNKLEKRISELCALRYELIGPTHHKDRDCHYYIEQRWSYDGEMKWFACHYGYQEDFEIECDDRDHALRTLKRELTSLIAGELRRCALLDESEWEYQDYTKEHVDKIRAKFEEL